MVERLTLNQLVVGSIHHQAYLETMRENVARSRQHIVTQTRIITDLSAHGPSPYLETARDLIVTMEGHLAMEEAILERLEHNAR